MRLLWVVQRYGPEVSGGAERHCRAFATRMAARGHGAEVLTSCATSYVDWADVYPSGTTSIDGVTVHRLPVVAPRDDRRFNALNARVPWGSRPVALHLQMEWMRAQGPRLSGLGRWLAERSAGYDVVVFFTYLYWPTWAGLPVASGLAPTVLHPTAHEEPSLFLDLFDTTWRHPAAYAFSTPEERELIARRTPLRQLSEVVGVGVDLDVTAGDSGRAFRLRYGLEEWPYLLFLGRLDPSKGSEELYDFFVAYKRRNPGPLRLVVAGEPVRPLASHPEVVVTGFVDEAAKASALDGALALVQPSYFESFSMVLTEAWARRRPALVQGHCAVLDGQARRAGGAVPYRGFAEFEAAVDLLAEDPGLGRRLGAAGRRYVEAHYHWDVVLDRYEGLLETAVAAGPR